MQTQQNQTGIVSGATQVPLLERGQIRAGVWLTGIAAAHVWEVVEVTSQELTLMKLPAPAIQDHSTHTFAAQGGGQVCGCGVRRQPIKDFLPVKAGKARVYVLEAADRPLVQPKVGEFYAGMANGAPLIVESLVAAAKWSQAVPIVPELHKVWELPPELGVLLRTAPINNREEE